MPCTTDPISARSTGRERGFTLVELMASTTIAAVALFALASTLVQVTTRSRTAGETNAALAAARRVLEEMDGVDFASVFKRYNLFAADDPGGAGTAPGGHFSIRGLDPLAGDIDGCAGRVYFPANTGAPGVLTERCSDPVLAGMPADLDLDGKANDKDVVNIYRILPVVVRVEWEGAAGPMHLEFRTILCGE